MFPNQWPNRIAKGIVRVYVSFFILFTSHNNKVLCYAYGNSFLARALELQSDSASGQQKITVDGEEVLVLEKGFEKGLIHPTFYLKEEVSTYSYPLLALTRCH